MGDVAGDGGQCCPCGELSGCTCSGLACTLACRKKTGTAELCGFNEFAPGTPPLRYKRKTTSGVMTSAVYPDDACLGSVVLPAGVECRSKLASGTLCGFSEYNSPSSPPKKYRRQTISGFARHCQGTSDCPGGGSGQNWAQRDYGGSCEYNALTCDVVNDQTETTTTAAHPSPTCAGGGTPDAPVSVGPAFNTNAFFGLAGVDTVTTKTNGGSMANGVCGWNGAGSLLVGAVSKSLDVEDTDADAISRANLPLDWNTSGECSAHISYISRNVSNFAVAAQTVQTRIVISAGLEAGENYFARARLFRRAAGSSDPFVDSGAFVEEMFTAAGVGHTTAWLDVPQDAAWEYRVEDGEITGTVSDVTVDTWDVVSDFGPNLPASCESDTTDQSARTLDGEEELWPFALSLPAEAYDGVSDTDEQRIRRATSGDELCQAITGGYRKVTGEVAEELSEPDTDEDALLRASSAIGDWEECLMGCLVNCSAFMSQRTDGYILGFSEVQTAVAWTAVIGHIYNVKVRFGRRVLGTTGPFLFHSLHDQTYEAVEVSEHTDWINVPNETGWETVPVNCSVQDVT